MILQKIKKLLFYLILVKFILFYIGTIIDKLGIAFRTGHHCAQPIMGFYKIPRTIRVSFSFYNTFEKIDVL